jgi:hypothetical protein
MPKETIDKRKLLNQALTQGLGKARTAWKEINEYLLKCYDFEPVLFTGKTDVKVIRFRKSGKTLVTLTPQKGSFFVLVVLGKKEVDKVKELKAELSASMWKRFMTTKQFHDGRWLWIEVKNMKQLKDIKVLLGVKRKPK